MLPSGDSGRMGSWWSRTQPQDRRSPGPRRPAPGRGRAGTELAPVATGFDPSPLGTETSIKNPERRDLEVLG